MHLYSPKGIIIRNMKKIGDFAWPLNFDIYRGLILRFNIYLLYDHIGPTLGPEPLDPGIKVFSFHNLGEGLHEYHNHAFSFHIYIHIIYIYIKFITIDITCMCCVISKQVKCNIVIKLWQSKNLLLKLWIDDTNYKP